MTRFRVVSAEFAGRRVYEVYSVVANVGFGPKEARNFVRQCDTYDEAVAFGNSQGWKHLQ